MFEMKWLSLCCLFLSLALWQRTSACVCVCVCVCARAHVPVCVVHASVCFKDQRWEWKRGCVPWGRAVSLTNLTFELYCCVATSHFTFSKWKHTHTHSPLTRIHHAMPQRCSCIFMIYLLFALLNWGEKWEHSLKCDLWSCQQIHLTSVHWFRLRHILRVWTAFM